MSVLRTGGPSAPALLEDATRLFRADSSGLFPAEEARPLAENTSQRWEASSFEDLFPQTPGRLPQCGTAGGQSAAEGADDDWTDRLAHTDVLAFLRAKVRGNCLEGCTVVWDGVVQGCLAASK